LRREGIEFDSSTWGPKIKQIKKAWQDKKRKKKKE